MMAAGQEFSFMFTQATPNVESGGDGQPGFNRPSTDQMRPAAKK
jgi:hypothetical protein